VLFIEVRDQAGPVGVQPSDVAELLAHEPEVVVLSPGRQG
jgi:hypothetical protein